MINKNVKCLYCKNTGLHGDEFTGGESYCECQYGSIAKQNDFDSKNKTINLNEEIDL